GLGVPGGGVGQLLDVEVLLALSAAVLERLLQHAQGAGALVAVALQAREGVFLDEVRLDRVVPRAEVVPEAAAGRQQRPGDEQTGQRPGHGPEARVRRLTPLAWVEHRNPPFP